MHAAKVEQQFALLLAIIIYPFHEDPKVIVSGEVEDNVIPISILFISWQHEFKFHTHANVVIQIRILIYIKVVCRIIVVEREESNRFVIYTAIRL